ncbi:MAG: hypothetical protein ABIK12_13530, partial [Pseudomonadota bacterium]
LIARAGGPGEVLPCLDGRSLPGLAFSRGRSLEVSLPAVNRGWHQVSFFWRSCPRRDCYLLVDRLELLPGGPG